MPKNLNAIIRYHTIDRCLRNPYRSWTVAGLQEACAEALYEAQGRDSSVSERTIRDDIRIMRSDILGYNAPIAVKDGAYYYTDRGFSITNSPLAQHDMELLGEVAGILKQLTGFRHFEEITALIKRIGQKLSEKAQPVAKTVQIDQVPDLKGLEWLDVLRRHIQRQEGVQLRYRPFHHTEALEVDYSPYLLKEYNRRWFVIGRSSGYERPGIFALDRIEAIHPTGKAALANTVFRNEQLFKHIIGVTIPQDEKVHSVRIKVFEPRAGYVRTKPLHASQQLIEQNEGYSLFGLQLMINKELLTTLLQFGKDLQVLGPKELILQIKEQVERMHAFYK